MIDRKYALPISQQARLVGVARSSVYYRPQPVSEADQLLMRRIDELHMEFPFAGARMLARLLRREGHEVGRRRVRTLMKRMGVEALYCKPNTSRRNAQHKIWPYLLRGMKIDRANQAWALDTTYIPMARGFVYLTAVVDWSSRKVLAHRVAITLEAVHAVEALEEAFARYGRPDIVNTDQAVSSRPTRSPRRYSVGASGCRWTAREAGATTYSSNGSGGASSTKRST
ncbi:integrase core domain protein [Burkholderia pseudomallei MSHR303]|nr:integrase core domain protein [Burkholderia pseudomallei MSHR305]AHK69150.1 integrase core domain protein [Burkholderia pseudomallei MSHR520]AIP83100.1 integrase core domain protein [Burkholderia pseudomallei]KGW58153.1 integrase core domain protein [Burkholderia pseudomallei MSHR303]